MIEGAVELVRRDVEEGLGRIFPAEDGEGFRVADPFAGGGELSSPDGETAAVAWVWTGRHEPGALGVRAAERTRVEVSGVTLVQSSKETGEPEFSRYVDWMGAFAQLGVGLYTRPVVD